MDTRVNFGQKKRHWYTATLGPIFRQSENSTEMDSANIITLTRFLGHFNTLFSRILMLTRFLGYLHAFWDTLFSRILMLTRFLGYFIFTKKSDILIGVCAIFLLDSEIF